MLAAIVKPEFVWQITESWKSSYAEGPSEFYIWSTRLGGVLCIVAGVAGIIALSL